MKPGERFNGKLVDERVRPQLVRQSHDLSISRRALGSMSLVTDLLLRFEQQLFELRRGSLDARTCADAALSLLRELCRHECGESSLDEGIDTVMDSLGAEPWVRRLVGDLKVRAERAVRARLGSNDEQRFRSDEALQDLTDLCAWYGRRKATLLRLSRERGDGFEVLGEFSIHHDRTLFGVSGLEVRTAAILRARAQQRLWFRVQVLDGERSVMPREQWRFWSDETDSWVTGAGSDDTAPFASLVPLDVTMHCAVLDDLRAFIPYAALELPSGRCPVTLLGQVIDERGAVLLDGLSDTDISVPDGAAARIENFLPSPSSMGLWPRDPVSGSAVRTIRVTSVQRENANRQVPILEVRADLELHGLEDQELEVQCRVLTTDGELIESELARFAAPDGTFLRTLTLHPLKPCAHYFDVDLSFPVVSLAIEPGPIPLMVEVCVLNRQRGVICGSVEPLDFTMPQLEPQRRTPLIEVPTRVDEEGMRLSALDISIDSHLDDIPQLKVCASLSCDGRWSNWATVVFSVRAWRGHAVDGLHAGTEESEILVRRFLVKPEGADVADICVSCPLHECVSADEGAGPEDQFVVQLSVVDERGRILTDRQQLVALAGAGNSSAELRGTSPHGVIVSLERINGGVSGRALIRYATHISSLLAQQGRYILALAPEGDSSDVELSEPVLIECSDVSAVIAGGGVPMKIQQLGVLALDGPQFQALKSAEALKVMLFEPSGRLVDSRIWRAHPRLLQSVSAAESGAGQRHKPHTVQEARESESSESRRTGTTL
jgi:hypothetical protein